MIKSLIIAFFEFVTYVASERILTQVICGEDSEDFLILACIVLTQSV